METYARELIAALLEETDLSLTAFLSREAAADHSGPWTEIPSVTVPVHARRRPQWVRGEQQLLPQLARRTGVELVHSLASTAPLWGAFRRVVTIHDVIYRRYPESHSGLRARAMSILVPLAARRSHRIIVPSESTRKDLTSLLHVPVHKVDVVPEGVRLPPPSDRAPAAALRRRLALGDRPMALTLSAKRPHKNLAGLLEALSLIPAERRPVLLLPGYETVWEGELRRRVAELGVEADTRFLGWVTDDELEELFSVAACFVYPSLYEGFGLPVLEAMARGVPVACSDRASLPEVAGGAALLFDPASPASIADAIETLLSASPEVACLRARGRARAAQLTWRRAALATAEVYRQTLAS